MPLHNQQSHQNRADQHHYSYIKAGVKGLIAGGGPQQAGARADGAEREIDFLHPSPRDHEEPEKNGRDDGKNSAENPRAGAHGGR